MERVTKTVTAAGSGQEQTSVEETYGEAAAYPYAAGHMPKDADFNCGERNGTSPVDLSLIHI